MILPGARSMLGRKPLVTPVFAGTNAVTGVLPPGSLNIGSSTNVSFAYSPYVAPTSLQAGDLFMIIIMGPYGYSSYNLGWSVLSTWPFTIFYCIYNGSALPSNFFQFSSTAPYQSFVWVFRGANPTTPLIASFNSTVSGSFITAPTVTPGASELIFNIICAATLVYPGNITGKGQASSMGFTSGWTAASSDTYVEDSPSWADEIYMNAYYIAGVAGVSQPGLARTQSTYGNAFMGISIRILPI